MQADETKGTTTLMDHADRRHSGRFPTASRRATITRLSSTTFCPSWTGTSTTLSWTWTMSTITSTSMSMSTTTTTTARQGDDDDDEEHVEVYIPVDVEFIDSDGWLYASMSICVISLICMHGFTVQTNTTEPNLWA